MNRSRIFLIISAVLVFFAGFLFFNIDQVSAADCTIRSASFSPFGQQADSWYKGASRPLVKATIDLANPTDCQGKTIQIDIRSAAFGLVNTSSLLIPVNVQTGVNKIVIPMNVGEDECYKQTGYDCHYWINVRGSAVNEFKSYGKSNGELLYECDGLCLDGWQFDSSKIQQLGAGQVPPGGGQVPPGGGQVPGQPVTFVIPNPIQAESLADLARAIGRFLLQIAIPIAVIIIIYAGLLFLTSGGNKDKIAKAKQALLYAVIGLAVILIGQGFVTLIKSILDLGR